MSYFKWCAQLIDSHFDWLTVALSSMYSLIVSGLSVRLFARLHVTQPNCNFICLSIIFFSLPQVSLPSYWSYRSLDLLVFVPLPACLCVILRGSQRDVVYLSWPIAPSYEYMSPNAGARGGCGASANEYSCAQTLHMEPKQTLEI